jgi:hypothetical protein
MLLAVGSKDLYQAEKEIIVCQAEQIHFFDFRLRKKESRNIGRSAV